MLQGAGYQQYHSMGASQSLAQLANMRHGGGASGVGGFSSTFQQQQQRNIYSNMPALQMGPRGRGRPVGTYKGDFGRAAGGMGMNRPGILQ